MERGAAMQTDEDPDLTVEVDADGYRVDHRSETEQSSQAKEVHEYPDRTEIRLRDEKEVRLEEVKTRETTRQATYDDIIALLDAQLDGLDEIQTSREVTVQEFNQVETTRETVTDGELRREIRTTDEKRKEEILEDPTGSRRVVTMETETVTVQPSPGALSLQETESPLSQVSDITDSSSGQTHGIKIDPGLGTEPAMRGGFNVGITPGETGFQIRSAGLGDKTPEKTELDVVLVGKQSPGGESGSLSVPGDLNFAENTGSLHRIQHRAHRIEELIVEDVDTFYEDQSKPAKRHSGLLGVKKEKRGKSQSPPATLEKRPKREEIKAPTANEGRLTFEVENVTPKPSPERQAQPAGVGTSAVARTADIVIQPDVQVSGFSDKPRDVIVGPQDANTNSVTYVVSYDYPGGVKIRDSGKRKKDVHPKKKKDKRRMGKLQPETGHDMPAEAEFVTYVVNYDRTEPLDGENKPPRAPIIVAKPEGSFSEPSIPREPKSPEKATIEVDMHAGDVKVTEPFKVPEQRHGDSRTFVVNYDVPVVEKSAKPGKSNKKVQDVRVPFSDNRQSPNEEFTYIVNYDLPSVIKVPPPPPPASIEMTVETPRADFDLEKEAPIYSITVVEPEPEVPVEKARKSLEKPAKKLDPGSKDAVELTYIVNYDDGRQGPSDQTDNFPGNDGGGEVWIRPPNPTFEAQVRGNEKIKAKPAEQKVVPGNIESLTYVVEYERGAGEKSKGGVPIPKLKKDRSSDDAVEKMYTYIVNYDKPASRPPKKEKNQKEIKKGKDTKTIFKAEEPRLQKKSYEIEDPSPELSFTVQHHLPEPVTKPVKPNPKLFIAVKHPIPEPAFEQSQEFTITVDHPYPEPVTKPDDRFEEFSIRVDHPYPGPIPEPLPEHEDHFEEFTIAVDHPFPEPPPKPEEHFEEFSITVDNPFPEPVPEPEEHLEEFFMAVDHPFPEPVTKPEERFEEFSITVDHPIPEPEPEPEEYFEEFSVAVDHPFPEPVTKPEPRVEEFSIRVDHPIPEARLEIQKPVLPLPRLPEPVAPKDSGDSLTFVVNYETPTVSGKGKPTKAKKSRKPLFSKGSKSPVKAKAGTEISPDTAQTFTYVVNYDEPSKVTKPVKIETERFTRADVKAPKLKIETAPRISGPKEPVDQGESLSITVTQPVPKISGATPVGADVAPSESAEGITYIVHHEEPFSVDLAAGGKHKKVPKKEAELKLKKPEETEFDISVLPEESAMPVSSSDLTIVVEHPEPKRRGFTGDISGRASSTAETLTYIVNYEKPTAKVEKVKDSAGKRGPRIGFETKKPRADIEVETPKIVVKTPEPHVETPEVPVPPSGNESISFTVVHEQPDLRGTSSAISTDSQWTPESSKDMTFIVNYELPSKTEQEDEVPEIEIEAPATIEILPSREIVNLELRDVQPSSTLHEPETEISVKIEKPDIPAPSITMPAAARDSITYIVQYDEPLAKTIGKKEPEKGKTKKKPSTVVSTETATPTVTIPKKGAKEATTEQVTFVVNYGGSDEVVIPIPAVIDTTVIKTEAEESPEIEPFDIPEPEVEIEEPISMLSITVEEPLPKVSAKIEPPAQDIAFKVKEPIVTTPDIVLPKRGTAKTITYVVTHEEPATKIHGKDKKKRAITSPGKKTSKDAAKAGASVEAKEPEVAAGIAGGVPLYEITVKTETGPSADVRKKKNEMSIATPEAAISVEKPPEDFVVQAQTRPQSITYVVNYDDSAVIPKSTIKETVDIKKGKTKAPKVKPSKTPKGELSPGEGESITYIVAYDDPKKFVPQPEIEEPEAITFEAQHIHEVKLPEIPADYEDPNSELTITVEQPLPEISVEVKPPTPEIIVKRPSEVEQFTITVEQPLPELSPEIKPVTPKVKVKAPSDVEQFTITVEQPLPEVGTKEVKLPTPEVKVKKPTMAVVTLPSVEFSQADKLETITYVVTYDEPTPRISGEAKPGKKEKKRSVLSFPGKKVSKNLKIESDLEAKGPKAAIDTAIGVPIYEVTVTTEKPKPDVHAEGKKPEASISTSKPVKQAFAEGNSLTYVVTYDHSVEVPSLEKTEPAAIEVQAIDIPHIEPFEIPEAEVRQEEPSSELSIVVEHPRPDISAEIKAPTPEIKVKGPSEVVVKPPSVEIPKAGAAETITYIVTHEEPAIKAHGDVKPEKKKRGFVIPGKKISKDVKAGAGVKVKGPEATTELTEGVPVYEVSVTTEHPQPSIDVKKTKSKVSVTVPGATKPSVEIAGHEQAQSITYVVTYDDTEAIPAPAKKAPDIVKVHTKDIPKITIPEVPETTIELEEPSSQLTITVEQPEISTEVKPPTPEIKLRQPSDVEQLTITVEQPIPEITAEVKPPTPDIKIRDPSVVEQLTITVEQPLPEVSTTVKPPIQEVKVKKPAKIAVGPPSAGLRKEGTAETFTYIVTHEDRSSKTPEAGELKIKDKKAKVAKGKAKPQGDIKAKKPATEFLPGESVTFVVTYDDSSKVVPATKIKSPEAPELEFKAVEPDSQLTITVEEPLPEIHTEVKLPTPEIDNGEPSEVEQLTITVEQPLPEISTEVKPPTPEIKIREPSDVEQLTITVEQPLVEVSTKVKKPSEVVVAPPSIELSKEGTAETFTYIVTHEDREPKIAKPGKKEKRKISFPGKYFKRTKKYRVTSEAELKEPKTKKPATELSPGEAVTYVVKYDDISKFVPATKIKSPEISESEFKVKEPSSELTITVEQPIPEIHTEVKPPTPEIKIRGPSEVQQLTITVEQPLPEISAQVKPPTPEVKLRQPSDVEQLTITVEQPIPEVSTTVKPSIQEVKVKTPAAVVVGPPSVEVPKGGSDETVTFIVTHEDRTTEKAEPVKKEKKAKIRFPGKNFGKNKKYEVTPKAELKEPKVNIKAKKQDKEFVADQVVTYVVAYDDPSEIVPATKIKSPEIPASKFKAEEPGSQLTIKVEQPIAEVTTDVKLPTPEIKVREPSDVEQLTITVEQPLPEIKAEVKPPTPEIKLREPSDVEQLTITVEQPILEVSKEAQPSVQEVKVKKPSEVVVRPPSVELAKGGTAETYTYIVTHEDRTPKNAEPNEKEKKAKIRFPGKLFGRNKTYEVTSKAKIKEPKVSDVAKEKAKPESKAHIKVKKPTTELSPGEVITYVVTYDDSSKVVQPAEVKSPEVPESKLKVEEPESQLTIQVEQPLPEIRTKVKPPSPEIKVKEPFENEQLTITIERPIPEISADIKPPTPEIKLREPSEVEQLSITIEQPLPEVDAEIRPPTPEIKLTEPSVVEQLTISIEQPLPEVDAEVRAPAPEIKLKEPSEVEQLTITVEQPLHEISAEAKLPTRDIKVESPSKIAVKQPSAELPKTETITYTVTHEEPTLKVSGEAKPEVKEKKPPGIRVPGKKLAKDLKAGAGIAAKGPTAAVTGDVSVYEVTVTTEPVEPEATAIPGSKDATVLKDNLETFTYVVEHEPQANEGLSVEGREKRRDWIWRVKKPSKSIDISTESEDKEAAARIEPDAAGVSAKIREPKFGISAGAETPGTDVSISTDKAQAIQEISRLVSAPETHTYVVTYDEPQVTKSKGKRKLWPLTRKTPSGKLEVKQKPRKNKWALFKKKEPKIVKPRVEIELADVKPKDVTVGETLRGDIDVKVPGAPSVAIEEKETIPGDISETVAIPAAPEFSVTVFHEEPSIETVVAPHPELTIPEAGEADLEVGAEKPADVSQLKFDVEAKLPGRKEQVLAEKVVSGKAKVADAEAERTEPGAKDRTVITGEDKAIEEETVVYIVTYEQPFGSLTRPKDGAKEASGSKPSAEAEVAVDAEGPDVTSIKHSVQVQMPQLEQCILVPIRDESAPEDSFYGTEAPVPAWPPVDEPYFEEEEDTDRPPSELGRTSQTSAVDEKQQIPPHLVVVAVDFGTTFSGYAFSFSRDSAGSIHVMRKWEGGDPGAVDHKTPTILLLTPGGQFHSFGFTARDFYHDLSPKEASRWLYFEKFKMALHFNEELNTETKLSAANGQCVAAIDVFTHALRFFRKHVLQEVSDQVSTEVLNEDIYWIITVPAIWTEEAKQFMRLAAYRAGIASPSYPDQLLISLEPEAASIYVRKQRLHQLVPEVPFQRRRSCRRSVTPEPTAVNQPIVATDRRVLPTDSGQLVRSTTTVTVSWPVVTTIPQTDITVGHQVDTAGTRYMVVDCGGGTVDITVHEIQSRDGTLRELHRATGGPFGSVAVDQEFEKLLVEIFGVDFVDVFKAKRPAGWVDLLMAFESRKRAANPYNTKPLNVSLPFSFIDYHKKYRNCPVEHAIRKYGNRDVRWSSQGMLRLMPEAMNKLFLPAIDKIKEAIGNVLNEKEVKGLRFLFLVGGFADSPMLQMAIRQDFGHLLRIIIPNDASISILKGAVCFGLDPSVITTRKSRMTYGVGVLNRFVPGQHPPSKLLLKDGEEWCTDVFDALVYADQSVAIGDTVLRRYTLVPGDADDVTVSKVVNIYSADRGDVKYVTESGVTRCGTLCLTDDGSKKPSSSRQDQKKDQEVQVRMTFGHTEIKVTAFELGTRKSVRATIDFLNK